MKWLMICLGLLLPAPAAAAPMLLALTAGNMLSRTHTTGLFGGSYARFRQLSGQLNFDPVAGTCHIDVTLVVQSLAFPNGLVRSTALGPSFLDAARYKLQRYVGDCYGDTLHGMLTMHGRTLPLDMRFRRIIAAGQLVGIHAAGALNRYAWGIDGLKLTVGSTIYISNDISLTGQPPRAW